MSEVMKAIQLTQFENELVELRREINRLEGVAISKNVAYKFKRKARNLIPVLEKKKDELINLITEISLLG